MFVVNRKLLGLSMGALIVLSGCSTTGAVGSQVNQSAGESRALQELVDISVEARHELRILAKARESLAQEAMTSEQHQQRFWQATHVPKGFEKRVANFNYVGPASKAAEAIAMLAGYEYKVKGQKSVSEPWVKIVLENEPLNEALKELGLQTGDSILVEIQESVGYMIFNYR